MQMMRVGSVLRVNRQTPSLWRHASSIEAVQAAASVRTCLRHLLDEEGEAPDNRKRSADTFSFGKLVQLGRDR